MRIASLCLLSLFLGLFITRQAHSQSIKDDPAICLKALSSLGVKSLNDLSPIDRFYLSQPINKLESYALAQYSKIEGYCNSRVREVFFGKLSSKAIDEIKAQQMSKCANAASESGDIEANMKRRTDCLTNSRDISRNIINLNGGSSGSAAADTRINGARQSDSNSKVKKPVETTFLLCCSYDKHFVEPVESPGGLCDVTNITMYPCDRSRKGFSQDDPRTIEFEKLYRPELAQRRERQLNNPTGIDFFRRIPKFQSGASH